jgi:hypothetical protein
MVLVSQQSMADGELETRTDDIFYYHDTRDCNTGSRAYRQELVYRTVHASAALTCVW